jgi:hypothetical protein
LHQFVHQYEFGVKHIAAWPLLTELAARVEGQPGIAAWIAKRPVTDF